MKRWAFLLLVLMLPTVGAQWSHHGGGGMALAYADGLLVSQDGGKISVHDASSGMKRWEDERTAGFFARFAAPAIGDGVVAAFQGNALVVHDTSGTFLWQKQIERFTYTQRSAAILDDVVAVVTGSGLEGLSAWSGRQLWQHPSSPMAGAPVAGDCFVHVPGHVECIRPDGRVAWTTSDQGYANRATVGPAGILVMHAQGATLLDRQGVQRWQVPTDEELPLAVGRHVLIGGPHGVRALDGLTGQTLWSRPGAVHAAAADMHRFYLGFDGVTAVDQDRGDEQWHAPLGGNALLVHDGIVYSTGGGVFAILAATGSYETRGNELLRILSEELPYVEAAMLVVGFIVLVRGLREPTSIGRIQGALQRSRLELGLVLILGTLATTAVMTPWDGRIGRVLVVSVWSDPRVALLYIGTVAIATASLVLMHRGPGPTAVLALLTRLVGQTLLGLGLLAMALMLLIAPVYGLLEPHLLAGASSQLRAWMLALELGAGLWAAGTLMAMTVRLAGTSTRPGETEKDALELA